MTSSSGRTSQTINAAGGKAVGEDRTDLLKRVETAKVSERLLSRKPETTLTEVTTERETTESSHTRPATPAAASLTSRPWRPILL